MTVCLDAQRFSNADSMVSACPFPPIPCRRSHWARGLLSVVSKYLVAAPLRVGYPIRTRRTWTSSFHAIPADRRRFTLGSKGGGHAP